MQYPVINHNGKEYAHTCVTESLFGTAGISTTLETSCTSTKYIFKKIIDFTLNFYFVFGLSPSVY